MGREQVAFLEPRVMPLRARLWGRFLASLGDRLDASMLENRRDAAQVLLQALLVAFESSTAVRARASKLATAVASAQTEADTRALYIAHIEATVPSPSERRKDLRALDRFLDLEALLDRETRRENGLLNEAVLATEALSSLADEVSPEDARELLEAGHAAVLQSFFLLDKPELLRETALKSLAAWRRCAGPRPLAGGIDEKLVTTCRNILRVEARYPVWSQVAALELLVVVGPVEAMTTARERLKAPGPKDDALFRRNAVRLMASTLSELTSIAELRAIENDPSEHVRQELVLAFSRQVRNVTEQQQARDALEALDWTLRSDPSPRVRAIAIRELCALVAARAVRSVYAVPHLEWVLRNERGAVPLRVLCRELPSLMQDHGLSPDGIVQALSAIVTSSQDVAIAELAAFTLRKCEVALDEGASSLERRLFALLGTLREGKTGLLLAQSKTDLDEAVFTRALRVAARGDMGVSARFVGAGWQITRGETRRRKAWRILHEIRHPMPDKRKGHVHSVGRQTRGDIVCAPIGMAEVTPTRVPGERRFVPRLGSWAPFLPRVDDLLDACRKGRTVRVVSSAGVVAVHPPRGVARLRAWAHLTARYAALSAQRDASIFSSEARDQRAYVDAARALGFTIQLDAQPGNVGPIPFDAEAAFATPFFAHRALFPWVEGVLPYLLSGDGNTPLHLAIVASVILVFLVVRGAFIQRGIERARRAIPLTIGGWGTRGKSGSERIKAALFHGLGFETVVKTTGCEAMMIHCVPGHFGQEIFLYRPYDKATIWEQRDVLVMAAELGAEVFLWECMALNPRFVRLLGREWMCEHTTTLTNAYPDHEDIQGPTGEDVARVISLFMPKNGTTLTSEEQMLPILRDAAIEAKTQLVEVDPLEADLMPIDLVESFPYQEHPRNIALITRLAESLGVDRERAIAEMAEHVVADLGVLKTYPTVHHVGRSLTFSNGMSANERAGCLASWMRMGFDTHSAREEPGTSIVAVVNNRADRVARSRVFARIVVEDISTDRTVLIGTNLGGLHGFIREELEIYLAKSWVSDETGGDAPAGAPKERELTRALERLDAFMLRLKISPLGAAEVEASIARMMRAAHAPPETVQRVTAGIATSTLDPEALATRVREALADVTRPPRPGGVPADDIRDHVVSHVERVARRTKLALEARAKIERAATPAERNAIFREVYRALFLDSVHVIWDAQTVGNAVVDAVARSVPPGQAIRVMGIQNIKGTGLDFIYRWLSYERVRETMTALNEVPTRREELLRFLTAYQDWGLIDCREALDGLRALDLDHPDWSPHRDAVLAAIAHLARLEGDMLTRMVTAASATRVEKAIGVLEKWFDYLDSIYRRLRAQTITGDLLSGRVGHARAAQLMRELTGRGKGGYLVKAYKKRLASRAG